MSIHEQSVGTLTDLDSFAYHATVVSSILNGRNFDQLDDYVIRKEKLLGVKYIRSLRYGCGLVEACEIYEARKKELGL